MGFRSTTKVLVQHAPEQWKCRDASDLPAPSTAGMQGGTCVLATTGRYMGHANGCAWWILLQHSMQHSLQMEPQLLLQLRSCICLDWQAAGSI